jgi:predicted nucleic acid-binding protein
MVRVLLDTNVVSELIKPDANGNVARNLDAIGPDNMYISVLTVGEITKGIGLLGDGHRRTGIETWLLRVEATYGDRILPVGIDAARIWGQITARLRTRGIQLPATDGLIAATAMAHNLTVVTRNVRDFEWTGVPVLNPWLDGDDA